MLDLTTTSGVKEYLGVTPFKSTKVTPLSGGTANFIYRVELETPLHGCSTLIFKHGRAFVGTIPFALKRQKYEVEAIKFVQTWLNPKAVVKVPSVLHFDEGAAVIIMQDAGEDTQTLKQLLLDGAVSESLAEKIGNALGEFLANLHGLSKKNREAISLFDSNEQGKSISAWATYGRLLETLKGEELAAFSNPPLDVTDDQLETIAKLVVETTSKITARGDTLVMGDFWPGNIVLKLVEGQLQALYIIDWELAKTGLPGLDLGQFCAEIYTLRRFNPTSELSSSAVLTTFLQSYARSTLPRPALAFVRTTAVHIGAHLVAWTPRVEWGGRENTRAVVFEGVDLLVGGYTGSRDWLKASVVGPLIEAGHYLVASMSVDRKIIFTEQANPPLPIYSQAVVSNGVVYASGNIGCDRELNLVDGGVQEQTRAAIKNLAIVLKASGSGLEHILKVNLYLTNLKDDFTPMNEAYAEFFEAGNYPARTCIGVAALPLGALMEIECVAAVAK